MRYNVTLKSNTGGDKRNVSGQWTKSKQGGGYSHKNFPLAIRSGQKKSLARFNKKVVKALVVQFCLDGSFVSGEICVPANSDLWAKLPHNREESEGGL
jgi:hypothetical protein